MVFKKIFITGATGFVGKNLLPALVKKKYSIVAVGRGKKGRKEGGIRWVNGDLLKPKSFEDKIGSPDVIVHLAGIANVNYSLEHPREVISDNVGMLLNILEVARKRNSKPLIVFASTDRLYGKTKKKIVDETEPPYPIEPYTASKILGEIILETYRAFCGIPYIILRFDSIYGPSQPKQMFISDVARKMITQAEVAVGRLDVYKNFVYVGDAVGAVIAAIDSKPAARNNIYNIGGEFASLDKIFFLMEKIIAKKLNKKIKTSFNPTLVRKAGAEVSPFKLSTKKAAGALGWKPETPLRVGLLKTIDYFLKNYD